MTKQSVDGETASAFADCAALRSKASDKVTFFGRKVVRFMNVDETFDDGTVRCISCGQVDDDPWHKPEMCFAVVAYRLAASGVSK